MIVFFLKPTPSKKLSQDNVRAIVYDKMMDHWCLFRSTWGDLWWMNHYLHAIRCNALILLFLHDHYILHFSNQSIFRWMIFEYAISKAFSTSLIVLFHGNVCRYIGMSYKLCFSVQRRWNIHYMILILKALFL